MSEGQSVSGMDKVRTPVSLAVVVVVLEQPSPSEVSFIWLLIALPIKPPIRPALSATISPYSRSTGHRVHLSCFAMETGSKLSVYRFDATSFALHCP